ncbi:redoxin domain-containing protein [Anaplasmataceae bacterium AB001_6]|nr:redoxin domain-containing protein [Anaplasmataceae bacterium AB001_6]
MSRILKKIKNHKLKFFIAFSVVFIALFILFFPRYILSRHFLDRLNKISYQSYFNAEEIISFNQIADSDDGYVVHFFASWCNFCQDDHFLLLNYKDEIDIYGFALKENKKVLDHYLNTNGNPYKDILIDKNGDLIKNFLAVFFVPKTYVIGKDNKIVECYNGSIKEDSFRKNIQTIKES